MRKDIDVRSQQNFIAKSQIKHYLASYSRMTKNVKDSIVSPEREVKGKNKNEKIKVAKT
jgi:hypothetical protein